MLHILRQEVLRLKKRCAKKIRARLICVHSDLPRLFHGSPLSLKKFFIASAICTAAAVAAVPLNVSIEYRGITNRDKCSEKVIEILRDNDIYADSSSVKTEADDPDPGRFSPFYSVLISVDDSSS